MKPELKLDCSGILRGPRRFRFGDAAHGVHGGKGHEHVGFRGLRLLRRLALGLALGEGDDHNLSTKAKRQPSMELDSDLPLLTQETS